MMQILVGLIIVAAFVYFAFIRDQEDTDEQAIRKISRVVVVLFIVLGILFVLLINGNFD